MTHSILEQLKEIKSKKKKKSSANGVEDNNPTDIVFVGDADEQDLKRLNPVKEDVEPLNEILSIAQRLKKRQQIRRNRVRLKTARMRAMKRRANSSTITKRARKTAINNMKKKFSGGKSVSSMNMAQKMRVERIVSKRKNAIQRNTKRLLNSKRQQDRQRFANRRR